ncbi:MAG: AbgT family transporter [Bacilli bacterium]|nr:AbgT family transporter [Bacilli bacterium]
MKKIRKIRDKVVLHPIMSFLILILLTICISGILSLFDVTGSYNIVNNKNFSLEETLIAIENLFSLRGLKYIFSNSVSNFASFTPLSMLLITLLGIGIMDKTGFLDTLFYVLTRKIKKNVVTFVLVLTCIGASLIGDISYIILIPIAALIFKYGKRNPQAGIITAFAALSTGIGINVFLNSIDSTLLTYTKSAANLLKEDYIIKTSSFAIIMIFATICLAFIITNITEKNIIPKLGKYEFDEEEEEKYVSKKELKSLYIALGVGAIYLLIFIYNIIPGVPLGGNLLDYSQKLYIDKLFGYNSFFNSGFVFVITLLFFILGLVYGILTKSIKNQRDVCDHLSHSLDGMGKVLVLLFFASTFISILKYSNIGTLFTSWIANIISTTTFTGLPLIILIFVLSSITTLLYPSSIYRWSILSPVVVPTLMNSGISPEFAQVIFRASESVTYGLTPVMAYFAIYLAYMEIYNKDKKGMGLFRSLNYILPYSLATFIMWIVIIIVWYLISIPLGIGVTPVL